MPTNATEPSNADARVSENTQDALVLKTLSPSRAGDFKTCPQMYKFKSIDKIPTEPTIYQARGTAVHLALERLFEQPAADRTPERLYDLFRSAWTELKVTEYPDMFETVDEERAWGIETLNILATYFTIEDPTSFEPKALEMDLLVDVDHMTIRGILDRMEEVTEIGPDGNDRTLLVITDYKTGKAPKEQYAAKAFFALKIYALLIRIKTGVTPDRVRLLYLNGPTEYTLDITDAQLESMREQLAALWQAIQNALTNDNWPTKTSALCNWCDFKNTICPAWENEREAAASDNTEKVKSAQTNDAIVDA